LSFNWNVYKVFKNGNRAKAPVVTFECEESAAEEYFNDVVKKNFSGKFANATYQLIRSDLPQEEATLNEEEKFSKEKNRALARLINKRKIKHKHRISTGLVYCRESEWTWQWAALEGGTGKYLSGLSPKFKRYGDAEIWINNLVCIEN
jgi:hypothetical protein